MNKKTIRKELNNYLTKRYKDFIKENTRMAINKSKNKYLQCKQK